MRKKKKSKSPSAARSTPSRPKLPEKHPSKYTRPSSRKNSSHDTTTPHTLDANSKKHTSHSSSASPTSRMTNSTSRKNNCAQHHSHCIIQHHDVESVHLLVPLYLNLLVNAAGIAGIKRHACNIMHLPHPDLLDHGLLLCRILLRITRIR